jgi:hypothetical protein
MNADSIKPVERLLAEFSPAAPHVDRDRLMFLAGRASAEGGRSEVGDGGSEVGDVHLSVRGRSGWAWPVATAALAATSLALAIALAIQPPPRTQIVYRDQPSESKASDKPSAITQPVRPDVPAEHFTTPALAYVPQDNYLRKRDVALRMGLDALGGSINRDTMSAGGFSYGELLQGLGEVSSPATGGPARAENFFNM